MPTKTTTTRKKRNVAVAPPPQEDTTTTNVVIANDDVFVDDDDIENTKMNDNSNKQNNNDDSKLVDDDDDEEEEEEDEASVCSDKENNDDHVSFHDDQDETMVENNDILSNNNKNKNKKNNKKEENKKNATNTTGKTNVSKKTKTKNNNDKKKNVDTDDDNGKVEVTDDNSSNNNNMIIIDNNNNDDLDKTQVYEENDESNEDGEVMANDNDNAATLDDDEDDDDDEDEVPIQTKKSNNSKNNTMDDNDDDVLDGITNKMEQLTVEDFKKAHRDMDELFNQVSASKLASIPKSIKLPKALQAKLYPYQIEGYGWLMDQEKKGDSAPFFRKLKSGMYKCQITGQRLHALPKPVHGGILADEMGLGKTVQTIALILGNPPNGCAAYPIKRGLRAPRCTVIVSPLSLISNWEIELKKFTKPKTLKIAKFHGPKRDMVLQQMFNNQLDVVLTSYETLASVYKQYDKKQNNDNEKKQPAKKKNENGDDDVDLDDEEEDEEYDDEDEPEFIFDIELHRIVLDEAHQIRNSTTGVFKAVNALSAKHKICLTGTPFVNRPADIQSLLAFLRVEPVDAANVFKWAITDPIMEMKAIGLKRLRILLGCFALRRAKADVDSKILDASKTILIRNIPFEESVDEDDEEQNVDIHSQVHSALYKIGRTAFLSLLDPETGKIPKDHQTKIFTIVTRIGQACLHASLVPRAVREHALQITEDELEDMENVKAADILQNLMMLGKDGGDVDDADEGLPKTVGGDDEEDIPLSPKQVAILKAIEEMEADEKGVIFSQYTSFLDLVQKSFDKHGITYTRIDGKMSPDERLHALEAFSADECNSMETPRIILCSAKACGTGLNLVRGNHVFLTEPWWNESLEDQCMDRVHRIGQTRPVRVIRFAMKGSVEERMMTISAAKAALGKGSMKKLSREEQEQARLTRLRDLFDVQGGEAGGWDLLADSDDDWLA